MKFDPTKPVQQRCGKPARIICTDAKHSTYPIIALLTTSDGGELPYSFTANGKIWQNKSWPEDLINIPETKKTKFWVNVYPNETVGGAWMTKQDADKMAEGKHRFACIEVEREVKEGEGL